MSRAGEKKLINAAASCVDDSLRGLTLLYPGLRLHDEQRFVTISEEAVSSRVGILSGGGSGHEPFCAGYVGAGMLSAAVAGSIFASPPKKHILHAIRYLSYFYKGGVIAIIPNYTGDCLNFGMAVEHARSEGLTVDAISIGEDCASGENNIAGRRGMCGLLFAYKIAGALSANNASLESIIETLKEVLQQMATLGISLTPCSLPGQSQLFAIADDEMELGTGVHGEAGIAKVKLTSCKEAVALILDKLGQRLQLADSVSSVVVLVNNLGSSTQLEQNIVCAEVSSQLGKRDIRVERMYAGPLMTSLNMAGFQISMLVLPDERKEKWLSLLDQKTDAPCWVGSAYSSSVQVNKKINISQEKAKSVKSMYLLTTDQQELFKRCLLAASTAIIKHENKLNELDAGCGDGDCGTTLKHLAEGILKILPVESFECPAIILQKLSDIAETRMGGTSGAIYSLCFTSMAKVFTDAAKETDSMPMVWAKSWLTGVSSIIKYGQAQLGDRTIVDSIKPAADIFCRMLEKNNNFKMALQESLKTCKDGCSSTAQMKARAGRASYVSADRLTDVDAGAFGFTILYEAITNELLK